MSEISIKASDYNSTLESVINLINNTRATVIKKVNKEQIEFYWNIGAILFEKSEKEGWGKNLVVRMSKDLQLEFPTMKGINSSDLWRAKAMYENYKDNPKLGQLVREIPFAHNFRIFEKVQDEGAREFYLTLTHKAYWSRSELEKRIKNNDYLLYKKSQNNYLKTIPNLTEEQLKSISWDFKDEIDLGIIEAGVEKNKVLLNKL